MTESAGGYATEQALDPITFEVLRYKLDEIIAEAFYTIGRVSGSPLVYEVGDHQEAICTANGDLAVFGAGALTWSTSIGEAVRHLIRDYSENPGFEEDDQFLLNDAYVAASHASDVQVLAPVVWGGEVIAWAGSASHQMDIGGANPGSLCLSATEVFQEGFHTPGIKIVERGVIRRDIERTFSTMVRMPEVGLLDIRAKIASNNVMKTRLIEMAERYGADTVRTLFRQLIAYSQERLRARLATVPDGTWRAGNWVEGLGDELLHAEVAVTKTDDSLCFDFTGSSPQTTSPLNIGAVGARGAAVSSFVGMLAFDIPWNEGLFTKLEFVLPEGSIVNPTRPAPLSANVLGATVLILTTCQNALAQMFLTSDTLAIESCGNTAAGNNSLVFAGQDGHGAFFTHIMLDGAAGGGGGFPDRDGVSTGSSPWVVKTMIANVESNELLYPLLYLWRSETVDSGGAGEFRGGLGLSAGLIPWRTDHVVVINVGAGQRTRHCLGFAGGYPAAHTPVRILRGGDAAGTLFAAGTTATTPAQLPGTVEALGAKAISALGAGDAIYGFLGSGGGGYGDPLRRDPERVALDLVEGYVSRAAASETYGVVLSADGEVDRQATEARRESLRQERTERMAPVGEDRRLLEGVSLCAHCGADLFADGTFEGAGSFDEPISAHEPDVLHSAEGVFVLRSIGCRVCGTLLAVRPAEAR